MSDTKKAKNARRTSVVMAGVLPLPWRPAE
jgi:hypothetical protein